MTQVEHVDTSSAAAASKEGLGSCSDGPALVPVASSSSDSLKEQGNHAFKKAQLLRRTTAGKQFLNDAKVSYIQAIQALGQEPATSASLALVAVLHSNLAAVFLLTIPPMWKEAKAAADIALEVDDGPHRVKAYFRRAQAQLEDGREGLPELSLRGAMADLVAASELEPKHKQVAAELARVRKRLEAIEEARRVPNPSEILARVNTSLLDRGGSCLESHGYAWGQTESAVHIFAPARGKRLSRGTVDVSIRPTALRLALPALDAGADVPFELGGELLKQVRCDESAWQIEDGGLVLHVELAKNLDTAEVERRGSLEGEHWVSAFVGHPETRAPTARERAEIREVARAACEADARGDPVEEEREDHMADPRKAETIRRLKEMCPGVDVEWGDTSVDPLQATAGLGF